MPKIKANGINLYYEEFGEGEPLICIAGFATAHLVWLPILDALAKNYRVVVFDNRGVGQSDVPTGPYSIDMHADDAIALCDALGIQQAHFMGNSMGGYIVQNIGRRYADRVNKLIISNSTFYTDIRFATFLRGQLELMRSDAPRTAIIKCTIGWAYSTQYLNRPGMLTQIAEMMLKDPFPFTITGFEGQAYACRDFDSSEWLSSLKSPTLVVGGDQDVIFLEPTIRALAETIPGAEYYCFKEAGHLPFVEYPDEYVREVTQFLA